MQPSFPQTFVAAGCLWLVTQWAYAQPMTSLDNNKVKYTKAEGHVAILKRGEVEAVVVDNAAVDSEVLPGHRAGYSGIGWLKHSKRQENLFVPAVSGLNFEHIHDGTTKERDILFEPRRAPMELRLIDAHTVELYQPPTPNWKLESCHRYALLEDGTIEMTFECIPRERTFKHDYIGLFWASYIHQPESLNIHFQGRKDSDTSPSSWIEGITPAHGTRPTHLSLSDTRTFAHDDDFPLSLVFNRSEHRYQSPWYYGLSHGMAYAQVFRPPAAAKGTPPGTSSISFPIIKSASDMAL